MHPIMVEVDVSMNSKTNEIIAPSFGVVLYSIYMPEKKQRTVYEHST
jgi:hypothetical protein